MRKYICLLIFQDYAYQREISFSPDQTKQEHRGYFL